MRDFKFLDGCDVEFTPTPEPPHEVINHELIEQRFQDVFGEQTFVRDMSIEYHRGVYMINATVMTRSFSGFIQTEINPTESQDLL